MLGSIEAQYHLGLLYIFADKKSGIQNAQKSRQWLEKAAFKGDSNAQYALGLQYQYLNKNVEKYWLKKAATQGNVHAQTSLAMLYASEEAYAKAYQWLKTAAEKGYNIAQNNLGVIYGYGKWDIDI
ncbi:tetratricopeptide repeat protein [Suttonella ornithocola]|uniref:Sel1 repeat n=1 Tax=Suttonella ornithocola TaxID=279832 RepID=A0A380MNS9_9GAMM|nr:SEL1-like repeat protein [Suttonella ornithocola]SUO94279.1 Sel1 repeat [Suttonella ornithocola]